MEACSLLHTECDGIAVALATAQAQAWVHKQGIFYMKIIEQIILQVYLQSFQV